MKCKITCEDRGRARTWQTYLEGCRTLGLEIQWADFQSTTSIPWNQDNVMCWWVTQKTYRGHLREKSLPLLEHMKMYSPLNNKPQGLAQETHAMQVGLWMRFLNKTSVFVMWCFHILYAGTFISFWNCACISFTLRL